ncbi:YlzJ-like family protein [Alkalihalobacterium elongatum]|uniref:YlzJ-like family protein n=1 Tax=Alkalihalobacterium elongatum TaxID=2675466 RepID=UPI001C1F4170|nr:YlzJ-like family protein [Alkalihalobacterium elongatum]
MILYTMLPEEMIFPQDESNYAKQQTIPVDGGMLVVEDIGESQYKVVRLISSDPHQYLNENYAPGRIIMGKPQL